MTNVMAVLLAQDGGDGLQNLLWVIAVLILSGLGALSEKFKQKKEEEKRQWKPTRTESPVRPARRAPPRPARPATQGEPAAPTAPPTRPVPRRRIEPARPTRERPQPEPQRHVQPTVRQRGEKRRRLHGRRQLEPKVSGAPSQDLLIQLEKRADELLRQAQAAPAQSTQIQQMQLPEAHAATHAQPVGSGLTSIHSVKRLSIAELRRAIVLNEIIQPPLALREMQ